ncbi:MAG: hypothetical protein RhofKO_20390 [Rhodothermales bacterium]
MRFPSRPHAPPSDADIEHLQALLREPVLHDAATHRPILLAHRVEEALRPSPPTLADEMAHVLARWLRPVVVATLLVVLSLALHNTLVTRTLAPTTATDAVMGLPPVSLATAYALDDDR